MDLQDMTDLVYIYDGLCDMEKALRIIFDGQDAYGYDEGAMGKISHICDVIQRNSPIFENPRDNWDDTEFAKIIESDTPPEERAKKLLGMK